jgi:hypothetical protein
MNAVLHRIASSAALAATVAFAPAAHAADGWPEAAKPGAVVVFRHATAPGVGDPAGFKLDDWPPACPATRPRPSPTSWSTAT